MGKKPISALTDQQISEQIANASTGADGERMYRDHARDGDRRLYRHRGPQQSSPARPSQYTVAHATLAA